MARCCCYCSSRNISVDDELVSVVMSGLTTTQVCHISRSCVLRLDVPVSGRFVPASVLARLPVPSACPTAIRGVDGRLLGPDAGPCVCRVGVHPHVAILELPREQLRTLPRAEPLGWHTVRCCSVGGLGPGRAGVGRALIWTCLSNSQCRNISTS